MLKNHLAQANIHESIRRKDRYSLATRAIAAYALGGKIVKPLSYIADKLDVRNQPGSYATVPPENVYRFSVLAAVLPYVLDAHDLGAADGDVDDAVEAGIDALDGDPLGDEAREWLAKHPDDNEVAILTWELQEFYERFWPEIEALAKKLVSGQVAPENIPHRSWPRANANYG